MLEERIGDINIKWLWDTGNVLGSHECHLPLSAIVQLQGQIIEFGMLYPGFHCGIPDNSGSGCSVETKLISQFMSNEADITPAIVQHCGDVVPVDLHLLHGQHDRNIVVTAALHDLVVVDIADLATVEHLVVRLVAGLTIVLVSTSLSPSVTFVMIVKPTGADLTALHFLQLLDLILQTHVPPFTTIIESAACQFSISSTSEHVTFLATDRTRTPFLPELLHSRRRLLIG